MMFSPTHIASKRTKNRLKEHQGHGIHGLERQHDKEATWQSPQRDWTLFRCNCGWLGWLPDNEWKAKL